MQKNLLKVLGSVYIHLRSGYLKLRKIAPGLKSFSPEGDAVTPGVAIGSSKTDILYSEFLISEKLDATAIDIYFEDLFNAGSVVEFHKDILSNCFWSLMKNGCGNEDSNNEVIKKILTEGIGNGFLLGYIFMKDNSTMLIEMSCILFNCEEIASDRSELLQDNIKYLTNILESERESLKKTNGSASLFDDKWDKAAIFDEDNLDYITDCNNVIRAMLDIPSSDDKVFRVTQAELAVLESALDVKANSISPYGRIETDIEIINADKIYTDLTKRGYINEIAIDNKMLEIGTYAVIRTFLRPQQVISLSGMTIRNEGEIHLLKSGNVYIINITNHVDKTEIFLYPFLKDDILKWFSESYILKDDYEGELFTEWHLVLDIDELILLIQICSAYKRRDFDENKSHEYIEVSELMHYRKEDYPSMLADIIGDDMISALLASREAVESVLERLTDKAVINSEDNKCKLTSAVCSMLCFADIKDMFTVKDIKQDTANFSVCMMTDRGYIIISPTGSRNRIEITALPGSADKKELLSIMCDMNYFIRYEKDNVNEMNFCTECGFEMEENALFCSKCGKIKNEQDK